VEPPPRCGANGADFWGLVIQYVGDHDWSATLNRPVQCRIIGDAEIISKPDDSGRASHAVSLGVWAPGGLSADARRPVAEASDRPVSLAPRVLRNHIHESCHSKQLTLRRMYNEMVTLSSYQFVIHLMVIFRATRPVRGLDQIGLSHRRGGRSGNPGPGRS